MPNNDYPSNKDALMAFDSWIVRPENSRMPAYWAMIAFSAGWEAAMSNRTNSLESK